MQPDRPVGAAVIYRIIAPGGAVAATDPDLMHLLELLAEFAGPSTTLGEALRQGWRVEPVRD